ncbi:AMP-binding protein [Pseudomonas arsenicoxydans]|uniref:AMP-binding protein n=1 Tax=Pseudomonas arsenicoxydans TaxID=702115 RepID=A0A502GTE7_9PSED|nr:AMP-binding protein [Pseudomonas arsenicoxydans]TPG65667.1 AMP-binding protein [Pseudomonas arsenicoxydans]
MIDAILSALDNPQQSAMRKITVIEESGEEKSISYGALAQQALAVSSALLELGVARNDLVILALPASIDQLLLLTGCVLIGALPCTVALPGRLMADSPRNQIYVACQLFAPRLLIASASNTPGLQSLLTHMPVRVISTAEVSVAASAGFPIRVERCDADSGHHVQLTSGSTGRPKAAILSHRNVIANVCGIGGVVGYSAERGDASASWLPLHHDMGLVTLLSNMYCKAPLLLMQPASFIRNPLGWLKRMSSFGATTTAAPTFALQYCIRRYREASMKDVDLSKLRNIFVGAERVDEVCLRDFAQTFAPHGLSRSALQPCYGMAESTLAVTMHDTTFDYDAQALCYVIPDRIDSGSLIDHWQARRADDDSQRVETVLSMGRPIAGMQVAVRAPDGSDAKDREVGEIFIRGSSIMSGYLPAEGQTEHYQSGDWFATGDIGYQVDEHLFVLGRKKELIIIRGSNFSPHKIEDVAASHPLLASGGNAIAAFGVYDETQGTENLVILIELETKQAQTDLRTQLQVKLRDKFGFGAHAITFVPSGSLPRTTSGKLKRLECRKTYLQTALDDKDKTDTAQLITESKTELVTAQV